MPLRRILRSLPLAQAGAAEITLRSNLGAVVAEHMRKLGRPNAVFIRVGGAVMRCTVWDAKRHGKLGRPVCRAPTLNQYAQTLLRTYERARRPFQIARAAAYPYDA